jgi:hypothetical protein
MLIWAMGVIAAALFALLLAALFLNWRMVSVALIASIVVLAAVAIWYRWAHPTFVFHYRLSVEVEVDGDLHSGSGVVGVVWRRQPQFLIPVPEVLVRPYGQGIFVDLDQYGALVIPLTAYPYAEGVGLDYLPFRVFRSNFPVDLQIPRTRQEMEGFLMLRGGVELSANNLPQFIWLSRVDDPDLAQVVRSQDFERVIFTGVRFRNARIEISDQDFDGPVSSGLENKLPWLSPMRLVQENSGVKSKRAGEFFWNSFSIWRDIDD